MCGIFAYIGNTTKAEASEIVFSGLKKLEYRGYDSWGIATLDNNQITVTKSVGKIMDKPVFSTGTFAVGHTRWATHGGVTIQNAHPHYSSDNSFVVVHNGIVENYQELKDNLLNDGNEFKSETDTEVIVKLIEKNLKLNSNLEQTIMKVYKLIEGRNTILVLTKDGLIIGARNGSPLVLGKSLYNEYYLSSDTYSFADQVDAIYVLQNLQMIVLKDNQTKLIDMNSENVLQLSFNKLNFEGSNAELGNFKHYMEKEIYDTPECLIKLTQIPDSEYQQLADTIKKAETVYFIGSGTAANAAAQSAFYLRKFTGIKAVGLIGADCKEYWNLFSDKDILIALSQSGETADVIEVLEVAKSKGSKIASFVNMPGSMITGMSDFKFMANAGPEICVLSTKVFTSQIAWGYLIAKAVSNSLQEGKNNIKQLSKTIQDLLAEEVWLNIIRKTAQYLSIKSDIFMLGKSDYFNIVKEGMVKIIEGSYIHAHAIPAGDLKHYAITLIQKDIDVMGIIPTDDSRNDVVSALNQVKARGATVTGISSQKEDILDNWIPIPHCNDTTSIISIIPLQLLSYYLALYLGNDVDKPRNIAKSVTVK